MKIAHYLKKITNKSFLETEIQKIEPISGFAFEDNIEKNAIGIETVVMFGFVVYISLEKLELAQSNHILVKKIKSLSNADGLTSKAKLGIEHLLGV